MSGPIKKTRGQAALSLEKDWTYKEHPDWEVKAISHVYDRMAERSISKGDMKATLGSPDTTYPSRKKGRTHITKNIDSKRIDIIAKELPGEKTLLLVTVIDHALGSGGGQKHGKA